MSTLTTEQAQALKAIKAWIDDKGKWEFRLGGFAGTGKTFLIQHLINEHYPNALCCAPTGKAALVLSKKIKTIEVTTIHKLLYNPVIPRSEYLDQIAAKFANASEKDRENMKNNATLTRKINEAKQALSAEKLGFNSKDITDISPGQLVIIDEASMVTTQMYADFAKSKCKALFVGDPGQLPPVASGGWFLNSPQDFVLRTVQRQALDSGIIRLSMAVRENPNIDRFKFASDDCLMWQKSKVTKEQWLAADQVITGRNESRHKLNRFYRTNIFGDEVRLNNYLPLKGDKLICTKNEKRYFINGEQFIADSNAVACASEEMGAATIDIKHFDRIVPHVLFYDFDCKSNYINGLSREPWAMRQDLRELDYGYAITVHKAQGSEWDKVIIADDFIQASNPEFRKRWLYTAITRAKQQIIWVQP